jgi:hypothetical protein
VWAEQLNSLWAQLSRSASQERSVRIRLGVAVSVARDTWTCFDWARRWIVKFRNARDSPEICSGKRISAPDVACLRRPVRERRRLPACACSSCLSSRCSPRHLVPTWRACPTSPSRNKPRLTVVSITLRPSADSEFASEVWLPPAAAWNGKYLMEGGGGFVGPVKTGPNDDAVREGYATASTDTGHTGYPAVLHAAIQRRSSTLPSAPFTKLPLRRKR